MSYVKLDPLFLMFAVPSRLSRMPRSSRTPPAIGVARISVYLPSVHVIASRRVAVSLRGMAPLGAGLVSLSHLLEKRILPFAFYEAQEGRVRVAVRPVDLHMGHRMGGQLGLRDRSVTPRPEEKDGGGVVAVDLHGPRAGAEWVAAAIPTAARTGTPTIAARRTAVLVARVAKGLQVPERA
jgi:hypothetical protein